MKSLVLLENYFKNDGVYLFKSNQNVNDKFCSITLYSIRISKNSNSDFTQRVFGFFVKNSTLKIIKRNGSKRIKSKPSLHFSHNK
jgi:hypothetical protein